MYQGCCSWDVQVVYCVGEQLCVALGRGRAGGGVCVKDGNDLLNPLHPIY